MRAGGRAAGCGSNARVGARVRPIQEGRAGRRGGVGWPRAPGAGGSADGGWRLRGVEFDDKL